MLKVPYEVRKLLYADPDISDAAKTLFTVLAGFTHGGATDCDLPNEKIAKAAGMLRRSAERPYAELRKSGWIAYAKVRGEPRKIALIVPQKCVDVIRKIAEPIKEVPVKNQILTREEPEKQIHRSVDSGLPKAVFNYFRERLGKNGSYLLTDKRKAMIKARAADLRKMAKEGSDIEASVLSGMKYVIDQLANSKWHAGENPNGTVYQSLEICFRSTEQMEKWLNHEKRLF